MISPASFSSISQVHGPGAPIGYKASLYFSISVLPSFRVGDRQSATVKILIIWSTFCPFCRAAEHEPLQRLQKIRRGSEQAGSLLAGDFFGAYIPILGIPIAGGQIEGRHSVFSDSVTG